GTTRIIAQAVYPSSAPSPASPPTACPCAPPAGAAAPATPGCARHATHQHRRRLRVRPTEVSVSATPASPSAPAAHRPLDRSLFPDLAATVYANHAAIGPMPSPVRAA